MEKILQGIREVLPTAGLFVGALGLWIALQVWILPRLGIRT